MKLTTTAAIVQTMTTVLLSVVVPLLSDDVESILFDSELVLRRGFLHMKGEPSSLCLEFLGVFVIPSSSSREEEAMKNRHDEAQTFLSSNDISVITCAQKRFPPAPGNN